MLTRGSHVPDDAVVGRGAAYAVSIRFASYHAALLVICVFRPMVIARFTPS
jgi:hypothetical protein